MPAKNVQHDLPQCDQMMVPEWHAQALGPVNPLASMYLQHVTWQSTPVKAWNRRRTHHHDVFHMVAFSGAGSAIIGSEELTVERPVLVLTQPGQPHSFQAALHDQHYYNEITFSAAERTWSSLLAKFFTEEHVPEKCPQCIDLSKTTFNEFEHITRQLSQLVIKQQHAAPILCGAYVYQALFIVFRLLINVKPLHAGNPWLALRQWIDMHAEEDWGLEQLAERMSCSRKHVSRQFALHFGMPPMRYKKHILMERAAVLLRSTNLSLQDISAQLGIHDTHYFNRMFRQAHGIAPVRYRNAAHDINNI